MPNPKALRILVLFGNIPLWGQERANIQVYEALQARGVKSLFVTHPVWGHVHIQPALDARGLSWTTAPMVGRLGRSIGFTNWVRNIFSMIGGSARLLRLIRQFRPTGIHVANPTFFLNFIFALWLTRLPVIYRLGDIPASHHLSYRLLWRYLIGRRVRLFVCDSRFVQDALLKLGVPHSRSTVLYPAAPSRNLASKQLFSREEGVLTVVYVGQLSPHKGVHLVVGAAKELIGQGARMRVLIAGDFAWQNSYATTLIEEVREDGFGDRITFLGNVEDISSLFSVGDLHVCPTLTDEPLGLVVMESKELGKPSIVFPSGGLVELVTHGVDGYVCTERTVSALVRALAVYVANPQLCVTQGVAAKASLDRLGVREMGQRWEQIWRDAGV